MRKQTARAPMSRDQFLEWEQALEDRAELVNGVIKMMAGGTVDHNRIAGNVYAALRAALAAPCEAFQQNMRLVPRENEDATYPDVLVTCVPHQGGETRIEDATILVEVTSRGTERVDMIDKWNGYQQIATLRHYLVVSQNEPLVHVYSRSSLADSWSYRRVADLAEGIELAAVGVRLAMADIYARTRVAAAHG
jgi:Uma2 family endonuclease